MLLQITEMFPVHCYKLELVSVRPSIATIDALVRIFWPQLTTIISNHFDLQKYRIKGID